MSLNKTTDAVLIDNPALGVRYDIGIDSDGDILTDDFFDTAILVSLFSDKRALPSQVLESSNRRGWIGNEFTPGFEIGSRLWTLGQSRITVDVINVTRNTTIESLQWMITDNHAISTAADVFPQQGRVILEVETTRPNSKVEKRLFELWNNSGVTKREPL